MDGLDVILTAALVDIPINGNTKTTVEINFIKSSDNIDVDGFKQEFRSVHHFVVKDASLFGYGGPYNLAQEDAISVFVLSCSLTNPDILFTEVNPTYHVSSVLFGQLPPQVNIDETSSSNKQNGITMTTIERLSCSMCLRVIKQIDLYEKDILDTANHLLAIKLFDRSNRSIKDSNILASIEAYVKAMKATDISTCYTSLYIAFEKGVTADNPSLKDKGFDLAASVITQYSDKDVEDLRLFNNRLKHASRNKKDLTLLLAGEANLKEWIKKLKLAADKTILYRIS